MLQSYLSSVVFRGKAVEEKEMEEALTGGDLSFQLSRLRELYHRSTASGVSGGVGGGAGSRAQKRANEIQRLLPKPFRPGVYMDFGGADGKITAEVGRRVRAKSVYCCDLAAWENMHHEETRDESVRFLTLDTIESDIPMANCSVDFCTVLQVLHHLPNVERSLSELYRVLKPGGYLFIREHDVASDQARDDINMVHYLYEIVMASEANWKYLEHQPEYHSAEEWIQKLSGFRVVKYQKARSGDIHRVFHVVLYKGN